MAITTSTLASLITPAAVAITLLLSPPSTAADDDERARLRQAIAMLDEQPFSGQVVLAYDELHARAWGMGDVETARASIEHLLVRLEDQYAEDDTTYSSLLEALARGFTDRGDVRGARPVSARGLEVAEAAYGPNDPRLLATLNAVGLVLEADDDFEAARATFERAFAILGDAPHAAAGALAINYASTLTKVGEYEAAIAMSERAVAITRETFGPDHPVHATAVHNLGVLFFERRDPTRARPLFEQALAIREAVLGPDDPACADSLGGLAGCLREEGRDTEAVPILERIVAIMEAAVGADHLALAVPLTNLSDTYADLGDTAAALPLAQRALAIHEATLGPDHPGLATTIGALANIEHRRQNDPAALRLYERLLAIEEAALGPDHLRVARTLVRLGVVARNIGHHATARSRYERALRIREQVLGPDHPQTAESLVKLADLLGMIGDLVAARPLLERALAIQEEALGPDHPQLANTLRPIGNLHFRLGDLAGARAAHERALAIEEAVFGPDSPRVAGYLDNLGIVLFLMGDRATSRALYERALAIYEAAYGPDHIALAVTLGNLASLANAEGDMTQARLLNERTLAIQEEAIGPDHLRTATTRNNLADLLRRSGDFDGSRRLHEHALASRASQLDAGHPDLAQSLHNLTLVCRDVGDLSGAWAHVRRLNEGQRAARQLLATLTEGESYQFLAGLETKRSIFLSIAFDVGETDAAYAAVLDAKGQVARLTLQTRDQMQSSWDPEVRDRVEALRSVQARLARLALATDVPDREFHDRQLESLRTERDRLDRELRRSVELAEASPLEAADVAAVLPPASALVDLFVHRWNIPSRVVDGEVVEPSHMSEPHVGAWVLRPGDEVVRHVDLGPADAIETALREHLGAVMASGTVRGAVPLADPEPQRASDTALRTLLWDPLRAHLDGATTVFVSPDGALGTLPFETIRDGQGRFLVEDRAFVYLSDAGSLVEMGGETATVGSSLLAVGGVDYDRAGAPRSIGSARPVAEAATRSPDDLSRGFAGAWSPLPATIPETRNIVAAHRATQESGSRRLLLGEDATEERLKDEMPRHAILHLATHGFFQPDGLPSMWEQARDATNGERTSCVDGVTPMTATARRLTGLHPGLLSGLVLAGANRPGERGRGRAGSGTEAAAETDVVSAGAAETETETDADAVSETRGETETDARPRDDGYLTASEVTLLDLSNVDLVVLSACETGLGRPQSGEGLLGLRRAFHMAGADTVVSSLWSVKDESTSELMQSFYANLFFEGMGRHEALRAAQLEMLQRNRMDHGDALPSTWGAFVLSGEWR